MCKEKYFRYIILKADSKEDIEKAFNSLKNWSYDGISDIYGKKYYQLSNIDENAKVLFLHDNSNSTYSSNVLPIKTDNKIKDTYRYGYDFSENQPENLKENILFDLCKEISSCGYVFCSISLLDID